MKQTKPKELKTRVSSMLSDLLSAEADEPPPWKMQALKHAITYLAVEAKLEEAEYGGFFSDGSDTNGVPVEPRKEPQARGRKRGTLSIPPAGSDDDPGSGSIQ